MHGEARITLQTPALLFWKSLHWLKINERTKYKFLSLTYKVLTTHQPQSPRLDFCSKLSQHTFFSYGHDLARPPTRSSLKITNRSFRYAAPGLWNELPTVISTSLVRHSLLAPALHTWQLPSPLSPLASSLTRSEFHSELKTWLFSKSFPS